MNATKNPWENPATKMKYMIPKRSRSAANMRYIIVTKGPVDLKPRQKNRKYIGVAVAQRHARLLSTLGTQARRNGTLSIAKIQPSKNTHLDGMRAKLCI